MKDLTLEEQLKERYHAPTGYASTVGHRNALFTRRAVKVPIEPLDKPGIFGSSHFRVPSIEATFRDVQVLQPNQGWGRDPSLDYYELTFNDGKVIRSQNIYMIHALIGIKHLKATKTKN